MVEPVLLAFGNRFLCKRAKSLKHSSMSFNCERVIKNGFERLNLDVKLASRAVVRFSVWNDSEFWIGINIPGKVGWDFAFQGRGKLSLERHEKFMSQVEISLFDIETIHRDKLAKKIVENWSCYGLEEQ